MPQQPIELILVRHLASRLGIPVFVVDSEGDMVYFNEPAESVLGRRFDEIRTMAFEEWTTAFAPAELGRQMTADELPLVIALRQSIPSHATFEIVGGDGVRRSIEVSAFPLVTPAAEQVGAVSMFWERQV